MVTENRGSPYVIITAYMNYDFPVLVFVLTLIELMGVLSRFGM